MFKEPNNDNDTPRPTTNGEAASSAERRNARRQRRSELGPEQDSTLRPGLDQLPEEGPAPGPEPARAPKAKTTKPKGNGKRKGKGKERADEEFELDQPASPLTEWPPSNIASEEELSHQHALGFISRGAPVHRGHKKSVPLTLDQHYALYATTSNTRDDDGTDTVDLRDNMTTLMTLRIQGKGRARVPWETLEQPSYAFYWGQLRGTVTLNQWASGSAAPAPIIALRDSGVEPRVMTLGRVLERLQELQAGLEDDDMDLLYRILYKRMLRDPDRILSPHRTLDRQMTDLIMVLSRPDWIDFTDPRNQIVTRFIFAGGDEALYHKFFHQLLLSVELDMRIQSHQHGDSAREKLMRQIPPTIQWDLAVARRWRENVRVDEYGDTPDQSMFPRYCVSMFLTDRRSSTAVQVEEAAGQTAQEVRAADEVAEPGRHDGGFATAGRGV